MTQSVVFPFTPKDIVGMVIKRTDGSSIRYNFNTSVNFPAPGKGTAPAYTPSGSGSYHTTPPASWQQPAAQRSLSAYCKHDPTPEPIFAAKNVELYIADAQGCRTYYDKYDVVLDCGDILSDFQISSNPLKGDPTLIDVVKPHIYQRAQVLQIKWADRASPLLYPKVWLELAKYFQAEGTPKRPLRVLTACQGGHGRSGTSLTALMMALSTYDPLDAITHLRAVHCARAIESAVQHKYLNLVGEELGRTANAEEAEKITDFRARFMTLTSPEAKVYQARLEAKNDDTKS